MLLGTGEVLQQIAELVGRDDPHVDGQAAMGAQSDARLAGRLPRLHELELGSRLRERPRLGGGGDHIQILDAVGHPSGRPGQLNLVGRRVRPKRLYQLLAD